MMNKVNQLQIELQNFSGSKDEVRSHTQQSAKSTEGWVKFCFESVFGNSGVLVKMGSQQYPDFFFISIDAYNRMFEYYRYNRTESGEIKTNKFNELVENKKFLNRKNDGKEQFTKNEMEFWESSKENINKERFVRISVKSTKDGKYRINEHLPTAGSDVLFINFNNKKKIVSLAIANDIAIKAAGLVNQPADSVNEYVRRIEEIKKQTLESFKNLKKEFPNIRYGTTVPLLGTPSDKADMDFNSNVEDVEKILRDANIH